MSQENMIYCQHNCKNGIPMMAIPFGDSKTIVLCYQCYCAVKGVVLSDVMGNAAKKYAKDMIQKSFRLNGIKPPAEEKKRHKMSSMTWKQFKDFVENQMVEKNISEDTPILYIDVGCGFLKDEMGEFGVYCNNGTIRIM